MKNFSVEQVLPSIFLFKFSDYYQMTMHFLRYQEYYESPNLDFQSKAFTLLDFMEWYAKDFGQGQFSYTNDWSGFNLPGYVFEEVKGLGIPDPNKYDAAMLTAYEACLDQSKGNKFCVIAYVDDESTLQHEVAHGFYYLYEDYKNAMDDLISKLPQEVIKSMHAYLKDIGYTPRVFDDEIQAYFATGIKVVKVDDQYKKPFEEIFQAWYKK